MGKILIVSPQTKNLINFRADLICDIRKKNYDVTVVIPENESRDFFKKNGIKVRLIKLDKNSTSVGQTVTYYKNLKKIIGEENPDKVFSYTIKPVIFASIAAHKVGVKEIYSLICGLGMLFSSDSVKIKILRSFGGIMYKHALKYNKKVMFQNVDDINEFLKLSYVEKSQCELINGSGVNMKRFLKNDLPENKVSFLMVSRVLKEKGVLEYFEAAKIVKEKYPDAKFSYIGQIDENKNALNFELLKPYIESNIVEYIPETKEVEKYVAKCSVFVLPSYYREGIPKTLIEATAMGRPVITTKTPGCKETVVESENGLFVKTRDAKDLADKMIWMIEHEDKLQEMGNKSYEMCKEKFAVEIIDEKMMEVMGI